MCIHSRNFVLSCKNIHCKPNQNCYNVYVMYIICMLNSMKYDIAYFLVIDWIFVICYWPLLNCLGKGLYYGVIPSCQKQNNTLKLTYPTATKNLINMFTYVLSHPKRRCISLKIIFTCLLCGTVWKGFLIGFWKNVLFYSFLATCFLTNLFVSFIFRAREVW